jgi:phosphoribosylamine--glycine ligase
MVLEYNTRFGDPETQAILMRLNSDLLEGLQACVEGRLSETEFRWRPGASACVIAASAGYPGSYTSGARISGLAEAAAIPGVQVFHAGTALLDGEYLTAGGRVLGVSAAGATLEDALTVAYEGIARVQF